MRGLITAILFAFALAIGLSSSALADSTGYEGQPGNQSNGGNGNNGPTGYEGQPGNQSH
jgi:hypothetical protein